MAVLTLGSALPSERKHRQLVAVLCLLVIAMIGSSGVLAHRNRVTTLPLDAVAVAVGPGGGLVEVSAADVLVPGSRVLAGMPDSLDLAREQAAWLAEGTVPRGAGLDSGGTDGRAILRWLGQRWLVPGTMPTPNALWASCSRCSPSRDCSRLATCPMAAVRPMIVASSSMGSAGRYGRLIKWLPN